MSIAQTYELFRLLQDYMADLKVSIAVQIHCEIVLPRFGMMDK